MDSATGTACWLCTQTGLNCNQAPWSDQATGLYRWAELLSGIQGEPPLPAGTLSAKVYTRYCAPSSSSSLTEPQDPCQAVPKCVSREAGCPYLTLLYLPEKVQPGRPLGVALLWPGGGGMQVKPFLLPS